MYYNIELSWDPKIIGVKNGVYQVELDKNAYDKKTYARLNSFFISNEFTAKQEYSEIDFQFCFKKMKSAKMTSFMSFSPNLKHSHFLIQNNVLKLFKKFRIQYFKDYHALIYDVETKNSDDSYRLFYSVLQDWNSINFEKTIFTSGGFGKNPLVEHSFSDESEMKKFNGITKVRTLALAKDFDTSLDFFHTRLGGIFISERLKKALEENNVTGLIFRNDTQVLV